jgi:hypothetical protein
MENLDTLLYAFLGGVILSVIPVIIIFPFYLAKSAANYAVDMSNS